MVASAMGPMAEVADFYRSSRRVDDSTTRLLDDHEVSRPGQTGRDARAQDRCLERMVVDIDAALARGTTSRVVAVEKVERHIADATAKGAKVLLGGHAKDGLFFEPTVLAGATADMVLAREPAQRAVRIVIHWVEPLQAEEGA